MRGFDLLKDSERLSLFRLRYDAGDIAKVLDNPQLAQKLGRDLEIHVTDLV